MDFILSIVSNPSNQTIRKICCSVCHSEEDFDVQIFSPDDLEVETITLDSKGRTIEVKPARKSLIIYHCRRCGHEITLME